MTITNILVGLVALIHSYIVVLEMFLWDKPLGHKAFGLSKEFAIQTKTLAANQGLYNGFLAAGLIWGLLLGESGTDVKIFFLSCVVIAGVYGAWSTKKIKILYIQALPAVTALTFVLL